VADLVNTCPEDLTPGRYVQTAAQLTQPPPDEARLNVALDHLLDTLVG
jgi:hypothetical protein